MLIRQTIRYLPAQLLAPAFQLLSMVVWTYYLAPHEMGSFALISATQEIVALVGLSWFSVYALRYMPFEQGGRAREDFLHTEAGVIALSILISLAAALVTLLAISPSAVTPKSVLIIGFFYATRGANNHYAERARAQSNILAYTLLQTIGPVLGFLLGLGIVANVAPTSDALLVGYGIAQLVANLIAAPMIGVAILPRLIHRRMIKAGLAYGGPILLLSCLGWFAENNFRYVVEHLQGAAAFGLLAVGWGLGRRCASFGSMLVTAAAFPIAARLLNEGKRDEALRQLSANAALLIGVMAPTVVGLAMISDSATSLLIAEPYRETSRAILGLATLGGAIRFLHIHITDQLFILEKRFAYAATVDVVEIAATIGFTAAGLIVYGPVGAVAGAALGSALATITSVALAVSRLGFILPTVDVIKVIAATCLMALGLALLPEARSVPALVGTIAVGAVIYGVAIATAYQRYARGLIRRFRGPVNPKEPSSSGLTGRTMV